MPQTFYGPSQFEEARFAPYALAVGQFAFAWNDYHEQLGQIFALLTAAKGSSPLGVRLLSAWGAVSNDRVKREMLLAVIEIADESYTKFPSLHEDVKWLVNVGTQLEEHRNNIIHAPYSAMDNALVAALSKVAYGSIQPSNTFNKRAARLRDAIGGKELLQVLHEYRDTAARYGEFARLIAQCLRPNSKAPWPDRPLRLGHEKKSKSRGRHTIRD